MMRIICVVGLCLLFISCSAIRFLSVGQVVNEDISGSYFRQGERIISLRFHEWGTISSKHYLEEVDADSFQPISGAYGRDTNHIYYLQHIIKGADLDSFELLDFNYYGEGFSRDKKHLYFNQNRVDIAGLDVDSFEQFKLRYFRDKAQMYYVSEGGSDPDEFYVIEGATPDSFVIFDRYHAKDQWSVFYKGLLIMEADAATFEVLHENYRAQDQSRVYVRGKEVSSDPDGYEIFDSWYSKDREYVYYRDSIISEDSAGFQCLGWEIAKNNVHVFYRGEVQDGIDTTSFRAVSNESYYYIDKNRLYYFITPIKGVDMDSLEVLSDECLRDKYRYYVNGRVKSKPDRLCQDALEKKMSE